MADGEPWLMLAQLASKMHVPELPRDSQEHGRLHPVSHCAGNIVITLLLLTIGRASDLA